MKVKAGKAWDSLLEGKQQPTVKSHSTTTLLVLFVGRLLKEFTGCEIMFPNVNEGLAWDTEKMKGYMKGAQWFNPMTVIPHTLLQQKIPQSKHRSFDRWIKIMGMMFDDMGTIVEHHTGIKTSDIQSYRSTSRVAYCIFVDLILLANILRMFAILFIQDPMIKFYMGDMSYFWTKRPHFVTVPIMYLFLGALGSNVCFQFMQPDIQKRWLVPFGIFTGAVSPMTVRIRSIHQLKRLVQVTEATFFYMGLTTLCWSVGAGVLYIGVAILYTAPHLRWFSVSWAVVNTILSFYCIGIIGWSLAYFYVLSYHLRMRFKRLNKITYALLDENGVIPISKRSEFMAEVIYEHDKTAYDTLYANRFWKFWVLVMYCLYVPLQFWLIYTCCFYKTTWIVKIFLWMGTGQLACNILIVITAGEMVSNQAHMTYRWLNTLCLHKFPVSLMFKMAEMIERLAGPTIGFSCYDYFVVARETFYDMMVMLGTQFFLVADFVLSYM